ncbi:MAG: sensor histidine kinase [Lachnospiraceae bacterium]
MYEKKYVVLFQSAILAINIIAVGFVCIFIYVTTEKIIRNYEAREFLDNISKVPSNPELLMKSCIFLIFGLLFIFILRQIVPRCFSINLTITLTVDFLICLLLIILLDFNYNGLILLLFANIIYYIKDGKFKIFLVALAVIGYLVADYELISIYTPLFQISDYIKYYPASIQQNFFSFYNILISLNIILFIIYCIYVISSQNDTIEEVNVLYNELQKANEQLQEYANVAEKMTQTKERNRLAREIHDTLGHTLTGLTAGIDACIATIDNSPNATKEQLKTLSLISREGINEVRRSVNELRPDALERLCLEVAIEKMITDMSKISDIHIFFETDEKKLKFDEDEENAIYRVIQESITNTVRYGQADKIWIVLKQVHGELFLNIKDNGVGCEKIKYGFGTRHIKERIEMLHGTVSFEGTDGFSVNVRIPIRWGEQYD